MDEQRNELPAEEKEVKSQWQQTKESWYDKLPVTAKQMDIIVYICWALLGLAVIAAALDAMGVF